MSILPKNMQKYKPWMTLDADSCSNRPLFIQYETVVFHVKMKFLAYSLLNLNHHCDSLAYTINFASIDIIAFTRKYFGLRNR